MAISLVAMATATLILFFNVVFELIEERIWFICVHYVCISEKLRQSFNRKR